MRRILLAVALAGLAPAAAAEPVFHGEARMGLVRDGLRDGAPGAGPERAGAAPRWRFEQGLRLSIGIARQTDGGLTFGGRATFEDPRTDLRR